MNKRYDPPVTVDIHRFSDEPLEAGLTGAFSSSANGPHSTVDASTRVLLEPEVESNPGVAGRCDERYQLFDEIGRGGMGSVLLGRDVALERDLAVKVLLREHS